MREKNERGGLVDWNEGGRGRVEIVMLRGGQGGVFWFTRKVYFSQKILFSKEFSWINFGP